MNIEEIRDRFIKSFDFIRLGLKSPTILTDTKIGFSAVKEYTDDYVKSIGMKTSGKLVSLFHILIKDNDFDNEKLQKKPVIIRASFNYVDGDKFIVITDVDENKKKPVDLISRNDFFYNLNENKFFNNKNEEIKTDELFNEVYNLHIKPTKKLRGLWFRTKLRLRSGLSLIVKLCSIVPVFLLWCVSGESVSYDIIKRYVAGEYLKQTDEKKETTGGRKKIKIFDYEATSWSIFAFCVLHLTFYTTFFLIHFKSKYLTTIFSNNFLTVMYVVPALAFFEIQLPKALRFLIKTSTT